MDNGLAEGNEGLVVVKREWWIEDKGLDYLDNGLEVGNEGLVVERVWREEDNGLAEDNEGLTVVKWVHREDKCLDFLDTVEDWINKVGNCLFLFVFAFQDRDFLEQIDADDNEGLGGGGDFEADLRDINLVPKLSADCSVSSLDAMLAHRKVLSEV